MSAFTLADWAAKHPNINPVKAAKKGFDYAYDTAYSCRTVSAKIEQSQRGDTQLCVEYAIMDESRDVSVGKDRLYLTLPCQESDDQMTDEVSLFKMTLRRRDDIGKLLGLADPDKYSLHPHGYIQHGKRVVTLDEHGNKMASKEREAIEQEANKNIIGWCEDHRGNVGSLIDDLANLDFWIVKVENKKNSDFPYTNLYNVEPDANKYPPFNPTGE